MPWRTTSVREQRIQFVIRAQGKREALARLCREFGISRPTGHLWLRRYQKTRTLTAGNFGDCKSLGQGLYELRVDWGPGYRVYYAMIGTACVLLLCGGDKRKQAADIARAWNT